MESVLKKQVTLRGLGEEYRKQAEALGEQIQRRREAFQTEQFTMNAYQKEQYYYDLATLQKQKHDAEATSRALVYYYEHGSGKRCNPDGIISFTVEVMPACRAPKESPSVNKAG